MAAASIDTTAKNGIAPPSGASDFRMGTVECSAVISADNNRTAPAAVNTQTWTTTCFDWLAMAVTLWAYQ